MTHIHEILEKKEKCIIFSQFLGMLALIEHDLKGQKIDYLVRIILFILMMPLLNRS